jgi:cold shock protein
MSGKKGQTRPSNVLGRQDLVGFKNAWLEGLRYTQIWSVFAITPDLAVSASKPSPRTRKIPDMKPCEWFAWHTNAFARFYKEAMMATGTVKFFNAQKGFGFIVQDRGGPDVFVHISAVERAGMRNLNEGQKLSFDVQADPRSGKSAAANLQAV